jgi:hypothetical protein
LGGKGTLGYFFTSPTSPAGLSSAAVVNKKDLREEKALAGSGITGHLGSHIQPELVNPIYAAENSENHMNY